MPFKKRTKMFTALIRDKHLFRPYQVKNGVINIITSDKADIDKMQWYLQKNGQVTTATISIPIIPGESNPNVDKAAASIRLKVTLPRYILGYTAHVKVKLNNLGGPHNHFVRSGLEEIPLYNPKNFETKYIGVYYINDKISPRIKIEHLSGKTEYWNIPSIEEYTGKLRHTDADHTRYFIICNTRIREAAIAYDMAALQYQGNYRTKLNFLNSMGIPRFYGIRTDPNGDLSRSFNRDEYISWINSWTAAPPSATLPAAVYNTPQSKTAPDAREVATQIYADIKWLKVTEHPPVTTALYTVATEYITGRWKGNKQVTKAYYDHSTNKWETPSNSEVYAYVDDPKVTAYQETDAKFYSYVTPP